MRIAPWDANGLAQHKFELELFLKQQQIDSINNITVPNKDTVRYLGMTLDRRLTWKQHILDKSKQLRDKLKKFYWLIGHRSNLSTQNKITLYKTVIKPVWTYGI